MREKLKELAEKKLVIEGPGHNERSYRLSEDLVMRWSQVFGLTK